MRRGIAALGIAALGIAFGATAPVAQAETVTALGTGQAEVKVTRPLTNAKIVRAVARARALAVPRAFINARTQGSLIAETARFVLGDVLEVEEGTPSPYGYYGVSSFGRFGPNRYCGRVASVTRGPRVNGRPGRVISRRTVVRCYAPDRVTVTLSVAFAAAPNPAPITLP